LSDLGAARVEIDVTAGRRPGRDAVQHRGDHSAEPGPSRDASESVAKAAD
jgi:hypothetical protein